MNLLNIITGHKHYWGIPHTDGTDRQLIQICYECGAHRQVKADLEVSQIREHSEHVIAKTTNAEAAKKAA